MCVHAYHSRQMSRNWYIILCEFMCVYLQTDHIYIYIYIYFFFFNFFIYSFIFIIQRVKAHAIPCPHQPPSKGDYTVLVAQGGTATPGATKQLLPPDRVLRESYIYIYARSIKCRDYIGR